MGCGGSKAVATAPQISADGEAAAVGSKAVNGYGLSSIIAANLPGGGKNSQFGEGGAGASSSVNGKNGKGEGSAWGGRGMDGGSSNAEGDRSSAVCVAVVVRPLMALETEKSAKDIVMVLGTQQIQLPSRMNSLDMAPPFSFDRVYRSDGQSGRIYAELAKPLVDRFFQGFNATVMAYGQTGSGKTFTMGTSALDGPIGGGKERGSSEDKVTPASATPKGIIAQALQDVFSYCKSNATTYGTVIKLSYLEIYNEQLQDLLADASPSRVALELRERPDGEVVVEGSVEVEVRSLTDANELIRRGNSNRAVGAHNLNLNSSRSHAVLTMTLEQRCRPDALATCPSKQRFLRSKLRLVDLAGSERVKDTGATGDRFQEGVSINKGLLELGNVINALAEREAAHGDPKRHVPYRNSKLTRLLQDSLGGNSETLFIACISPADVNLEQTTNTLRYATRARAIKNAVHQNTAMTPEEEVAYLREVVMQLQQENAELKSRLYSKGEGGAVGSDKTSYPPPPVSNNNNATKRKSSASGGTVVPVRV